MGILGVRGRDEKGKEGGRMKSRRRAINFSLLLFPFTVSLSAAGSLLSIKSIFHRSEGGEREKQTPRAQVCKIFEIMGFFLLLGSESAYSLQCTRGCSFTSNCFKRPKSDSEQTTTELILASKRTPPFPVHISVWERNASGGGVREDH